MRWLLAAALVAPGLAGCLEAQHPEPSPWPGAAQVSGPSSPPLPMLPLAVDAQGNFQGLARNPAAYRYCGQSDAPGLDPAYSGDDTLRYFARPDAAQRNVSWYADLLGQPARPEHFQPGQAAQVAWRIGAADSGGSLVFLVLRLNRTPDTAPGLDRAATLGMMWQDFAAFAAFSTHFCCLLTWHTERLARIVGDGQSWDRLFDPCHLTNFDPYELVQAEVPPALEYGRTERPPSAQTGEGRLP